MLFLTVNKEQSFTKAAEQYILPSQRYPDKWRYLKRPGNNMSLFKREENIAH